MQSTLSQANRPQIEGKEHGLDIGDWVDSQGLTFPALMSAMELLFSRRALAKMADMACWRIAKPMRMPCL